MKYNVTHTEPRACGMAARDTSFQVWRGSFPRLVDTHRALSNAAVTEIAHCRVRSELLFLFLVLAFCYSVCCECCVQRDVEDST